MIAHHDEYDSVFKFDGERADDKVSAGIQQESSQLTISFVVEAAEVSYSSDGAPFLIAGSEKRARRFQAISMHTGSPLYQLLPGNTLPSCLRACCKCPASVTVAYIQ